MNRKILLELIWWIFTILVCFLVLSPIVFSTSGYHFLRVNILFVVAFITITRYVFLLPHTFLDKLTWLKVILVLTSPIVIFLLVQEVIRFHVFIEENGWEAVFSSPTSAKLDRFNSYVYSEMLLFGVGSVISAVLLPFRMIVSVWRERKKRISGLA